MILVTGHHKQMKPAARLLYHVHHVVHQALEYVQVSADSHIVHTLGILRAESGSHTAGQ